jgi:adhesin transport system outer membrane protein
MKKHTGHSPSALRSVAVRHAVVGALFTFPAIFCCDAMAQDVWRSRALDPTTPAIVGGNQPRRLDWKGLADESGPSSAPVTPKSASPTLGGAAATEPKPPTQVVVPAEPKPPTQVVVPSEPKAQTRAVVSTERQPAARAAAPTEVMQNFAPKLATAPVPLRSSMASAQPFVQHLVARALEASPDIREARAKWLASQHDIDTAKGERWPQVQVGVATPSTTFGGADNLPSSKAGANISVTTPVWDWGRIGSTVDSRTQTANASFEALEQARQTVAFDTLNALTELRRNQANLELSEAYVKRMSQLVSMLGQITERDKGRASELTQAKARRLQAVASRDQFAARLREIRLSLAKLVGEEVSIPPNLQWDMDRVQLQQALDAAADHPALRQARAEAKAATLYADSVKAARLPQVNWYVSKSTQPDAFGNRQPWSTNIGLQWNAFQGGSGDAAQRAAYERANAGEQRAQAATHDLEYRLRTSAEQRDAAFMRASEYGQLIKESDQVRSIFFEQWYHLGRRTLLDVLIAENEHYSNQVAQVNNRFDGEAADLRMRADAALLLESLPSGTPQRAGIAAASR